MNDRCRDVLNGCEGMLPVEFSRSRVEAGDAVTGPADEDPFAGLVDDDWRRIGCGVVQCSPFFLPGDFIEGDYAGVVFAADLYYDQTVFNQW